MFPGKIQWVWEKPCLYTPPEGIDCVFMEHAYLTQQVPDRLWRFFFFLARKHTSFQGTLFQAEATTGQCKYTSLSAGNENEWLPVVLFIPHLYIKLRSATVFAEALRRQYQVQPSGCQLRWNAHCVDSVLLILELEWKWVSVKEMYECLLHFLGFSVTLRFWPFLFSSLGFVFPFYTQNDSKLDFFSVGILKAPIHRRIWKHTKCYVSSILVPLLINFCLSHN